MPAMKPKLRDSLAVVELDGEAVIYNDDDGNLHHLNPTATIVMSLCDGTSTVREMAADIAAAFDLSPPEIEKQMRRLLRDFRKSGLLEGKSTGSNGR
jgi:PqqD family protein of HPr-rel-A system